jgi:hypothetical protein
MYWFHTDSLCIVVFPDFKTFFTAYLQIFTLTTTPLENPGTSEAKPVCIYLLRYLRF